MKISYAGISTVNKKREDNPGDAQPTQSLDKVLFAVQFQQLVDPETTTGARLHQDQRAVRSLIASGNGLVELVHTFILVQNSV